MAIFWSSRVRTRDGRKTTVCFGIINHNCCVFLGLNFVGIPILTFFLLAFFGAILASLEMKINPELNATLNITEPALVPWTFNDGFLYCGQNILSFCNPIVPVTTNTQAGIVADMYASVIEVALFGAVCALVDRFEIADRLVRDPLRLVLPRVCPCLGCARSWDRRADIKQLRMEYAAHSLILMFFALPCLVMVLCVVAGSIVASSEGWPWQTGMYFTAQNVLGLANPITNPNLTPVTRTGIFNALYWTSVALSLTGVIVAALGSYPTEQDVKMLMESLQAGGAQVVPEPTGDDQSNEPNESEAAVQVGKSRDISSSGGESNTAGGKGQSSKGIE